MKHPVMVEKIIILHNCFVVDTFYIRVNVFCIIVLPETPKIKIISVESTQAYIKWKSNRKGLYTINCVNCPTNKTFPLTTNSSYGIKIEGLGSFSKYELEVQFENNITKLIDHKVFTKKFTVQTKAGGWLL